MKKYIILILFAIISNQVFAQFSVKKIPINLFPNKSITVNTDKPYNGFAITSFGQLDRVEITLNDSNYKFKTNGDLTTDELNFSDLIVLNKSVEHLIIKNTSNKYKAVMLILQYTPMLNMGFKTLNRRGTDCDQPPYISAKIWRKGLPLPKPNRARNTVKHIVVHHSADGNNNANYAHLVRSYYTYHTQTKGWDDIGYNFLIAANGVVFQGRDSMNSGIEIDNVRGAHYCAKNQGTMGICLIGDFKNTSPHTLQINSLVKLASWKLHKEGLIPYDSFPHPQFNDVKRAAFIGHRQGCSTTCPGNVLFAKMPQITKDIHEKVKKCAPISIAEVFDINNDYIFFKNGRWVLHTQDKIYVNSLKITDLKGKNVPFTHGKFLNNQIEIQLDNLSEALYFLTINSNQGYKTFKISHF